MMSQRWFCWCMVGLLLAGCRVMPAIPPPTVTTIPVLPEIQLPGAPGVLCREATQLRLEPLLNGPWPDNGMASWQLTTADAEAVLATGEWAPVQGDLLITFPKGLPLMAEDYLVVLRMGAQKWLTHTFTILPDVSELREVHLLLTPDGPTVERLPAATRVFYVAFRYAGVCPGAPLWLSVSDDDLEVVCAQSATLTQIAGEAMSACYRDDGAPFSDGLYHATLTLAAPGSWTVDFYAGAEPTPPPPPPPTHATHCDPPFVAAALDPQAMPLLSGERFEWYTQAVYIGARCYDLPPATPWTALWYREGTLVREFEGVWVGGSEGVLWDSLVGIPEAPFLRFGTYTVTLAVSAAVPLTTAFRVIAYTPPVANP